MQVLFLEGFDIWKLLAGLGIFLFGMFLLEESIRKISGRAFKKLIKRYTTGRLRSIFSGFFVTSILQSSSAVSLMTLAFVGAGIMTMENGIGVILGSNIGTTTTAWIVATLGFKLSIEAFALPLIGLGGLGTIFLGRSERFSNISKLLVGFGFLFMGLDYMKTAVEVFTDTLDISALPNYGVLFYLGIGLLLTAIMQSSSASLAIALTTLNAGILDFNEAAALVIGANVGTTVTVIIGAIGATQAKKRVALSHFVFNMVTAIIGIISLPLLVSAILLFVDLNSNAVIALALFHTLFNVLGVILFYPFTGKFAAFLMRVIPDEKVELTRHINRVPSSVGEAAVPAIQKEGLHLMLHILSFNLRMLRLDKKIIFNSEEIAELDLTKKMDFLQEYEQLKVLQAEIFRYAAETQGGELSPEDSHQLNHYLHGIRMSLHAAKVLKDIKHDFDEFDATENDFLHDEYLRFKERMKHTYQEIDRIIDKSTNEVVIADILELLNRIQKEDRNFVSYSTKALMDQNVSDVDYSTAIVVNRAFVQSAKQLTLAIGELILDLHDKEVLESYSEVHN